MIITVDLYFRFEIVMAYGLSRSVIRILCSLGMNEVEEQWIWWGALTLMQSNTTCSCSFFRLQHLLRKEWDRDVVVMDRRIRLQWLDVEVYRDKNALVVHATHVLSLRVSTYALIFSGLWILVGTVEWSFFSFMGAGKKDIQ